MRVLVGTSGWGFQFFRIGPTPESDCLWFTHSLLGSSFLGLPYRILNMNHKKELLRSLWVVYIKAQGVKP